MGKPFYSKSRQRSEAALQIKAAPVQRHVVEKEIHVTESLLWIGVDKHNFFDLGQALGFNPVRFRDKDLSVLIRAKCLILCYADLYGKTISAVNFACEYGIPVLWHHKHLPPETYFWSFKRMFHNTNPRAFWETVCNSV